MVIKQNMLKDYEFRWLIAIQSKMIETFLENKVLFLRPVQLTSPDGERILRFLRNQIPGLVYCDFKTVQPASIAPNMTQQEEIKFFDKIYFQRSEDREKFEVNFSGIGMGENVVSIFDI